MWKLIRVVAIVGAFGGFFIGFSNGGEKDSAVMVVAISIALGITGICVPVLLKSIKEFPHETGLGSKLCAGAFFFMALPSIALMLNDTGEGIRDVIQLVGFPVFFLGILINIYKLKKPE